MPRITFDDCQIECAPGENLRRVLMASGVRLYNGVAGSIHCRGLGTCGTCAVEVLETTEKAESVSEPTAMERWRLSFPPHDKDSGLRLACQCKVHGDIEIKKHAGLWGHRKS